VGGAAKAQQGCFQQEPGTRSAACAAHAVCIPHFLESDQPSPATCPARLQVCDQAPETIYGSIVADKVNSDTDLAQAVGQIVYTAQAIMENAADKVGAGGGRLGGCTNGEGAAPPLGCVSQATAVVTGHACWPSKP